VPKKELVLIASRAISLYLVFWSLGNLGNIPPFCLPFRTIPSQPIRQVRTMCKFHLIQFISQIVVSTGFSSPPYGLIDADLR